MTAANCNEPKPRKVINLPPGAKLSYTVAEGAAALGVSSSTLWAMIKDGELVAKRLRGRTLLTREELARVLDEAPDSRAA